MKDTKIKICTCNWRNPSDSLKNTYQGTIYCLNDTTYILELDVPKNTIIFHADILNGQNSEFKFTLFNVQPRYSAIPSTQNNTELKTIFLNIDYIVGGEQYYMDIPRIKYAEIYFDGKIGEWCLNSQINTSIIFEKEKVKTQAITQSSQPLVLYKSKTISLKIISKINMPQNRFDDFIINQNYLLIVENIDNNYEEIEFLVIAAKLFISFLCRRKINFKSYQFSDYNSNNPNTLLTHQDKIEITYPNHEPNGYGIYFTSESIWDIQKAFLMWLNFCKKRPNIIDLYFHNPSDNRVQEILFKQLQCLENLHKHIFHEKKCYFIKRMIDLCNIFTNTITLIGDVNIFCKHLKNHRNYFAHLNESDRANTLPLNEMSLLSFDCNVLIDMCLLLEMGFPIKSIEERILALNPDMIKHRRDFIFCWS